ncbi:hypothetical protein EJ02DRAFT_455900 [Clathrospora elynae]|uniref:Uncharacterized protein n=1 Tax=Clathrospora elynae TaxID=706981 RepID=A0A6A5SPQ5_9PLEO|nr:hypothetical protein EJ02DRAFT_455900 [Clathrospora elynae]
MDSHPCCAGKAGVHNNRKAAFKAAIIDKTSGPYMAMKTHIETTVATLLQEVETELKTSCDDLFLKIFHSFDQICLRQEDDGFQALEMGKELREDIEEARRVLEGPAEEALLGAGIYVK